MLDCGIRTARAQGIQGLYRGLGITLLRDSPSYVSYFSKDITAFLIMV